MTHRIQVASHPDYERVVVEVYIDETFVCLLSQEGGGEIPVVEFGPGDVAVKVELKEFELALTAAKGRLAADHKAG
jgi:hypothetical protein